MEDVQQIKNIVPLIACEIPFGQHVCKLVFGVDILDLNFCGPDYSVKQPIKSSSVGSAYMYHCWTSAFDDHLIAASFSSNMYSTAPNRRNFAFDGTINIVQIKIAVLNWNLVFGCACLMWCYATNFPVLDLWCC